MKSFYQNWKLDPELPMDIYQSTNITFYPHFHAEIEFIYVTSGAIRIGVNEENRLLQQGDMVICGSNDIHYFDSRGLESEIIILICKPEWITMSKSWPLDFRFTSPYIPANTPGLDRVKMMLDELIREKKEKQPGYPFLMKAGIARLYGNLQRYVDTDPMDRSTKEKYESRRARMQQILSYIEDHYREELNVAVMAERFSMEPSHFSRSFKAAIGMNFKTYLNTVRVLSTEHQLLTSDLSILEIALDCGFSSIRTFNRVFKELRGNIPSNLRHPES
ncbi:AraC family transcriptional regulator [Paenibacillus sp. MBLB2552]|uniref:AraC family transcriptional regulator n=1 Tax=Paenibacillus mellifer TaxID=2937794 RepID=A0A9X1XY20_9BACL|nr:AraC family transcriptional regulator [Paenibacillus mellifer]MCK8488095.1 AraC family transcriptional regulator [Paenibacillus mellifer]